MQTTAKLKGLAKIWQEVKRPFQRRVKNREKIDALRACKSEIDAVFGVSSGIRKSVDALLKFYRWRLILGGEVVRLLRIPEPRISRCGLFAQHVGFNLDNEIQSTDEAWILDGIKLPHPAKKDEDLWKHELSDIVLPGYFRRKFTCFDTCLALIENAFGNFTGGPYPSEGPYEHGNVHLKEGDVVFDCGANMGLFSAMASRYGAEVYSFEAIPDVIDNYLSKTARMNGNISIHNFAVWDKEETLNFSLIPDNIGASCVDQLFLGNPRLLQNCKQFAVPAITLDAFVERHGIKRVDFIKADIEGAERNMLRGAKRILKEFAPKLSICTYHLPDDPQVLRDIILEANPRYQIAEKFQKLYAYVPQSVSKSYSPLQRAEGTMQVGGEVQRNSQTNQWGSTAAQPKISVIITVYNVETYLRQCLDSVVNQTLHEVQIICVNDGSTDGSLAILREYEARDSRIEIIDKPNGGHSSARNAGISQVRGKYLYFLDSDDWIEPTLCEKTYYRLESTGADVVFFFHHEVAEKGQEMRQTNPLSYCQYSMKLPQPNDFVDFFSVSWNRVIRTSFFQRLGVWFPEMLLPEDLYMHWVLLVNEPHVELIPEKIYYYRLRNGSIVAQGGEFLARICQVYSLIKVYLQSIGKYERYRTSLLTRKISHYIWYTSTQKNIYHEASRWFQESLDDEEMDFLRNDENLKSSVRDSALYLLGNKSRYWGYVWHLINSLFLKKIIKKFGRVFIPFPKKYIRECELRIQELSEQLTQRDRIIVDLQKQQNFSERHSSERRVA